MSNGVFHLAPLAKRSHQALRTEPSGPTQNTSIWLGLRATTATRPAIASPGAVAAKTRFGSHDPPATLASHHVELIDPSG